MSSAGCWQTNLLVWGALALVQAWVLVLVLVLVQVPVLVSLPLAQAEEWEQG